MEPCKYLKLCTLMTFSISFMNEYQFYMFCMNENCEFQFEILLFDETVLRFIGVVDMI